MAVIDLAMAIRLLIVIRKTYNWSMKLLYSRQKINLSTLAHPDYFSFLFPYLILRFWRED